MTLYAEGILWYIIALDCLIYNILCWTAGKWYNRTTHWVSPYVPINKVLGVIYLLMVVWVGHALLRMNIILFR